MDLKLNTDTYDLEFHNGGCPVASSIPDVVAQRLTIRLRTLFSEWFLQRGYGVPYLERILGHKVNKNTVDFIMQEQILQEEGVREIVSFSSTLDGVRRTYECRFVVRTDKGNTDEIVVSPPLP